MEKYSLEIEISHGGLFSCVFTCQELRDLENLILNSGTCIIGNKSFKAGNNYLTSHKIQNGQQIGGYDMDNENALKKIRVLLELDCK